MSVDGPIDEAAQDDAASDRSVDPVLTLPESLHVEQTDETGVTIFRSDTGARIRIPPKLYELVLKFETPRRLSSISTGDDRLAGVLTKLAARGFLASPDAPSHAAPPRLTTDPAIRLFDCPAKNAESSASDIAIIGVPYDFGDRQAAGARNGPSALRELSLQMLYRTHRLTGNPLGWYDADCARAILAGVSIGDCGDVRVVHGEPQASTFERVSLLVDDAVGKGALPVILGGDGTIIHPAIGALTATRRVGVVHLGMQREISSPRRSDFLSIDSLAASLEDLPGVMFVETISADAENPGVGQSAGDVAEKAGVPIFLSIDMTSIQGLGHSGYGPWDYSTTCRLIAKLGRNNPVQGLGLVGLNPSQPGWPTTGMTALHLLMQAMDLACDIDDWEKAA